MDIRKALIKLRDSGMTDSAIALEIGTTQPTVTRLRNGSHAKTDHVKGEAILALLKRRFPGNA
jgi:DNA transposition AAA+ family ATPase